MRWALVAVIAIHGLIHFMGVAKAFGLADLPQLTQPISRVLGVAWGAAGLSLLAAAVLFVMAPRVWWVVGFAAVLLSQFVILSSWSDAKFGTVVNVLLLGGVLYGFLSQGPSSFRAEYRRHVRAGLSEAFTAEVLTSGDVQHLPQPVQRYISVSGAVGQPRAHHLKAVWRGRIRAAADDPWMNFVAEQYNFLGEPSRFFLMDARKSGLPVDVLHVFREGAATMRVRLLSAIPLVHTRGAELTRAETVTLFNDLCLLAPAALVDPSIRWETIDDRTVTAHYTVGTNTISARLVFNEAGELVNFVSDDRFATSTDGKALVPQRWSTPVRDYVPFGNRLAASRGEGRWHPPEGEYSYIELELVSLEINP